MGEEGESVSGEKRSWRLTQWLLRNKPDNNNTTARETAPPVETGIDILRTIGEVAQELELPVELVRRKLDVADGTRLIFEKGLDMSEVELAMVLKGYRKRIFSKHLDDINTSGARSEQDGAAAYQRLRQDYHSLYDLHAAYQASAAIDNQETSQKRMEEIVVFLGRDTHVQDEGIDPQRFFDLLPQVLNAFSPEELEQMYAVNTAFRKKIALQIWKQLKVPVQIRGSLVRGDSRSFGNGYNANFSWMDSENDMEAPSGSDFDFKFSSPEKMALAREQYDALMTQVNQQGKALGLRITSDVDVMSRGVYGDGVPAEVAEQIDMTVRDYLHERQKREVDDTKVTAEFVITAESVPAVSAELLAKVAGKRIDVSSLKRVLQTVYQACNNELSLEELKLLAYEVAAQHNLAEGENRIMLNDREVSSITENQSSAISQILSTSDTDIRAQAVQALSDQTQMSLRSSRRETDFFGYADCQTVRSQLITGYAMRLSRYGVSFSQAVRVAEHIFPPSLKFTT